MKTENPNEKPACKHWFQIVTRIDWNHLQQVCRACKSVIFEWKDEPRDVRTDEGTGRP